MKTKCKTMRLGVAVCAAMAVFTGFAVQISLDADRDGRLYPADTNATVTVTVTDGGAAVREGRVNVRLSDDGGTTFGTRTHDLRDGNVFSFEAGRRTPGFVLVEAEMDGGGKTRAIMGLGFGIEGIRPSVPEPADFDSWWRSQFAAQAALRDPVELEPISKPELDARFDYFKMRIRTVAAEGCTYGFLGVPKRARTAKAGCIVIVQCAGAGYVEPETNFIREDMITLTLNVHPWDPTAPGYRDLYKRECKASPKGGYMYRGCGSRETCYFRNAVLGCKTAVEHVLARPDFNGDLYYVGSSQGGGFGLVLGGIFGARFRALGVMVPAMCDLEGRKAGRSCGWPNFSVATDSHEVAYYDAVNWAKRVRSPIYLSVGMKDRTCPASGPMAAYNSIPRDVPKFLAIGKNWPHATDWLQNHQCYGFLQNFMDPRFREPYRKYWTVGR